MFMPLLRQCSSGDGCVARRFVTAEALRQCVPMGLLKVVEAGIPLGFWSRIASPTCIVDDETIYALLIFPLFLASTGLETRVCCAEVVSACSNSRNREVFSLFPTESGLMQSTKAQTQTECSFYGSFPFSGFFTVSMQKVTQFLLSSLRKSCMGKTLAYSSVSRRCLQLPWGHLPLVRNVLYKMAQVVLTACKLFHCLLERVFFV